MKRRNFLLSTATVTVAAGCTTVPVIQTQGKKPKITANASNHLSFTNHPRNIVSSRVVTQNHLKSEIVIVGGGLAGVCAALAAARNGAQVVLVQDRSVLGGNSSSEIRMHIVGADRHGNRKDTDSRESGILDELRLEEVVTNPQRSAVMWDLLLYDKVRMAPNITLLLDSVCCGVQMKNKNQIAAIQVSRHGTEDLITIEGDVFIDSSGDGRLAAEAGAEFRVGREARSEFGESLAPPKADRKTMGNSILFTSSKHGRPMPFKAPEWVYKYPNCNDLPHRGHGGSWEYGYWWIEWGGTMDTIKDAEIIREDLMAVALGVWDHIKNSGHHPGSENWALDWVGFIPGKRESRRFVGDYILKEQDCRNGEYFEDGVAYGGWNLDLHDPDGVHTTRPPYTSDPIPLYNIPFRALYAKQIDNLLFAGRNISTTHVAFGSTRVMGTCSVVGQAVGTAAALCAQKQCTPRQLGRHAIKQLQQQLLKDDAYILGVTNQDPYDLCRAASVNATTESKGGEAKNINNGVHRRVYKQGNCWVSDPSRSLPQAIELRFNEPKRVRQVHLWFDTALSRQLTLSMSDHHTSNMIRGPQPETVKDYEIQLLKGNESKTVVSEEGNYLRKRMHQIEAENADGIRVVCKATHGDASARMFEIRAYE
ncbi:FAD-dependent oxidoreductase [bacterium]|nr:FAD-dependent oxidoreductase [bacterium]